MEPFQLKKAVNGVEYLCIPGIEEEGGLRAFFTTRRGGVSKGDFRTLDYGGYTDDDPADVAENRRRVYEALGITGCTQGFVRQVHGDRICSIRSEDILKENEFTINKADGLITDLPGLLITTLHADCLPLFFFDRARRVIAVSHGGWRGTAKGIGPKTVEQMQRDFGCRPEDITAAVGPGISLCCFEVGAEVYEEFKRVFPPIDECGYRKDDGKYMLDLKKINRIQLEEAGVSRVLVSGYCTKCNEELFFSHRRDHGRTGRMAAGMILLPA
ncbi:MAG: peptidoglycan editing factor PgeF [Firmicutes bacterium]|nr:peptidoglycan editing factor PgeF [Bacillota bacterium]